jgi:hypothetical protein
MGLAQFGKFLKKTAKKAIRISGEIGKSPLAGIVPGGQYLQMASQLGAGKTKSRKPQTAMQQFGGSMPTLAAYGGTGPIIGEGPYRGPGVGGGMTIGAGTAITTIGRNFPYKRVWAAVKSIGLTAVASALGMGASELAQILLMKQPKRRRRGITARQLASARRVNRVVCGWAKQLQTNAPARRRTCK